MRCANIEIDGKLMNDALKATGAKRRVCLRVDATLIAAPNSTLRCTSNHANVTWRRPTFIDPSRPGSTAATKR